MVDIALWAPSPALNDPYTAYPSAPLFGRGVEHRAGCRRRRDRAGALLPRTPVSPTCTSDAQIRRYGSREPLVLTALPQLLSAVAQNCVDPSRRKAVQTQIALVSGQHSASSRTNPTAGSPVPRRGRPRLVERPGTLAPPPSTFGQVAAGAGGGVDDPVR